MIRQVENCFFKGYPLTKNAVAFRAVAKGSSIDVIVAAV